MSSTSVLSAGFPRSPSPSLRISAPPETLNFISGTDGSVLVGSEADSSAVCIDVGSTGSSAVVSGDGLDASVDDESGELGVVSSARAIAAPWPVATAIPTPSATASAPNRPM